ncbi:DinB family protein [Deinococcus sp. QL22]|uniref:DinB family protein n=1 Tax=Deinococcus sp. QL22 TaxID=2939437 RepID=UPI002016F9AE|nr:DinB family protein [Deinococcus sp. QL22]UQN05451.1 DUF664 domain-containing protein [Deinococcus sp. QL22]
METKSFYHYLTQARRRLWHSLRSLTDEELSKAVIPTEGARCIKDFLAHIPMVEDGWFRGDLLSETLVMDRMGREQPTSDDAYWHHQAESLDALLAYWEAVETETLNRWDDLMAVVAQNPRVQVNEDRIETLSADEVMWHVMQHEVRHTAHIVQMIRLLGHQPPSLDLVFLTAQ